MNFIYHIRQVATDNLLKTEPPAVTFTNDQQQAKIYETEAEVDAALPGIIAATGLSLEKFGRPDDRHGK